MTFEEGEKLMKEMDTTPEELDIMWKACVEGGHRLIAQLDRCGNGWRDLNPQAIKTLPREYLRLVGN